MSIEIRGLTKHYGATRAADVVIAICGLKGDAAAKAVALEMLSRL